MRHYFVLIRRELPSRFLLLCGPGRDRVLLGHMPVSVGTPVRARLADPPSAVLRGRNGRGAPGGRDAAAVLEPARLPAVRRTLGDSGPLRL